MAATGFKGNYAEFADKRLDGTVLVGDYRSEPAMDTYLFAQSATTYSVLRLASMSFNDKVYAVRTIADAAGI